MVLEATLAACLNSALPNAGDTASTASRLEATFATLEVLRINGWRDQDWCRFIDYGRGSFSNLLPGDDDATTCNLFDAPAQTFDTEASSDFARIREAFARAGVSVQMAWTV